MFKIILLTKRKPGMSMEDFMDYYENTHTKLTRKAFPQMKRYRRNYITPVQNEMCADGESPFDCVTEAWFDAREDFDDVIKTLAENPDLAAEIVEDELNFFDRSKIWWFSSIQKE